VRKKNLNTFEEKTSFIDMKVKIALEEFLIRLII